MSILFSRNTDASTSLAFAEFIERAPAWAASEFSSLRARYADARSWYTGEALNVILTDENGEQFDLYPVRINPIPRICEKHAQAVLGEDRSGEAVSISVYDRDGGRIDDVENEISSIFSKSGIDSLVLEGAVASQIDGGVFLVARWTRDALSRLGVSIEVVDANSMYVRPGPDRVTVKEAWLIRDITPADAASYGVEVDSDATAVSYYEHWSENGHEIIVDGKVVTPVLPNGIPVPSDIDSIVPVVYVPHERRAGEFWGRGLVTDALKGLIKELNMRFADYGDAIARDASDIIVARNVNSAIKRIRVSRSVSVYDIGSSQGIPGKTSMPDMFSIQRQRASAPMSSILDEIYKHIRREAVIPSVADGEDEGSQRSSLTLETRFWPLTTHVRVERRHWSRAITALVMIVARMLHQKGVISRRSLHKIASIRVDFGDILPRDREQLITELVMRAGSNIGSLRHLMSLTGDIDDPDAEIEQIKKEAKELEEIKKTQPPQQENDQNAQRRGKTRSSSGNRSGTGSTQDGTGQQS